MGAYWLFFSQLLIILLGATNKYCSYAAVVVALFVALIIGMKGSNKVSPIFTNGIILLLAFQNLAIGIGAHSAGNYDSSLKILTQIPFITIFFIWIIVVLKKKKTLNTHDKWFIALLVCIVISPLFGWDGFLPAMLSVRNMTVFYMAYQVGEAYLLSSEELGQYKRFLVIIGGVMLLVGIVILLGGYPMYKAIGIHEVYIAKVAPFPEGDFPARFHTNMFGSGNISRMGSTYYEPVNLGYFYSLATLICIFANPFTTKRGRFVAGMAMLLGLVLSFGKGAYLITAACITCVVCERILRRILGPRLDKCGKKDHVQALVVAIMFFSIVVFTVIYTMLYGPTIAPHIEGVTGALKGVVSRPFGYGIGNGGNASQTLGTVKEVEDWLASGGETALMSYVYQIGIHGALCFVVCFCMTGINGKNRDKRDYSLDTAMCFYIPFVLLFVSILQDNTFAPQCIVPFMIMLGGMRNYECNS